MERAGDMVDHGHLPTSLRYVTDVTVLICEDRLTLIIKTKELQCCLLCASMPIYRGAYGASMEISEIIMS